MRSFLDRWHRGASNRRWSCSSSVSSRPPPPSPLLLLGIAMATATMIVARFGLGSARLRLRRSPVFRYSLKCFELNAAAWLLLSKVPGPARGGTPEAELSELEGHGAL